MCLSRCPSRCRLSCNAQEGGSEAVLFFAGDGRRQFHSHARNPHESGLGQNGSKFASNGSRLPVKLAPRQESLAEVLAAQEKEKVLLADVEQRLSKD